MITALRAGVGIEIRNAPLRLSRSISSPWVRGPAWDGFWMLSAIWLVPIALWLAHGYSDPQSSPLDLLYFALTAFFWIGHRLSSTYLAYCTEAYRPLLRSQPVRFVVIPALITIVCLAFFLPSDSALPWTREERVIAAAIVDYAWVTYHFAAQHFGALSIYRSRAGRSACVQTRRLDRFFALSVGGVLVFIADILAGAVAYQDQWIARWSFAQRIVSAQDSIRFAATAALLTATAITLYAELRSSPYWNGGNGRNRASAAKLVSFPGHLDFATLDSRHRTCVAGTEQRADSQWRVDSPRIPQCECPAMGNFDFVNDFVGGFAAAI